MYKTSLQRNEADVVALRKRVARDYALGKISKVDMAAIFESCDHILDVLRNPQKDEEQDAAPSHSAVG